MAEARLSRFDRKRNNQMGRRCNSDFASDCQHPRGNPLNYGIANEICKLCANSGVINPSGGRRLVKNRSTRAPSCTIEKIYRRTVEIYGEPFVPKLQLASVNLQSLVQNDQSLVLIYNRWCQNYKWLA